MNSHSLYKIVVFHVHTFYNFFQIIWLLRSNKTLPCMTTVVLGQKLSELFTEKRIKMKRVLKRQETKIKCYRTDILFIHRREFTDYSLLSFIAIIT